MLRKNGLHWRQTNLSQRNDGRCSQNPGNHNKIKVFVDNQRLLPEYYEETKKQRIGLEQKRNADITQNHPNYKGKTKKVFKIQIRNTSKNEKPDFRKSQRK